MVSHSLVIGYHGCDRRVANKIVSHKDNLRPSQNAWDWLGHGIYFWEDSYKRAERWAVTESQRPDSKIKFPAVLGAVIDLGNCLNLTDAQALKEVKGAYSVYTQLCNVGGVAMPENRGRICVPVTLIVR